MSFTLPPLSYAKNALEPWLSYQAVDFHYEKHHAGRVADLNALIKGTPLDQVALEDVIRTTASDPARAAIYKAACEVWNHNFFWPGMRAGGPQPSGALMQAIVGSFGGISQFNVAFESAAGKVFGNGWVWLVADGAALKIETTAETGSLLPIAGSAPLFCLDLWEHSYYLDYQNRRADFVTAFVANLINWDMAAQNLAAIKHP